MPFLKQWKTSNDLIKNVSATLQVLSMDKNDQNERLALFNAGEANVVNAVWVAQILGMNREAWLDTYQNLQIKDTHEMAITGKELIQKGIIKPGPQMGQVLNRLKLMVINDELKNESLALLNAVNKLQKDD